MKIEFSNDIAFTHVPSASDGAKGALVLLDGLPSVPAKKDMLMRELGAMGYDVFFPRYEGTWESRGIFLERSPVEAMSGFVGKLRSGIEVDGRSYSAERIFLLGASFGGGIALALADTGDVSKVCAVSPALSLRRVDTIGTLELYLREAHEKDYRFEPERWPLLINDELYCPADMRIAKPDKVLVIAGEEDPQIRIDDVRVFCQKNGLTLWSEHRGHMTLSKLTGEDLSRIDRFFSSAA